MKKTLIVNTPNFQIGGVENVFHTIMMKYADDGCRVIWITAKSFQKKVFYKDLVEDERIEKVFCKDSTFRLVSRFPRVDFSQDEDIVMVSFTPEYYVFGEKLRNKMIGQGINIKHFLVLMNFFGSSTYIEENFKTRFFKNQSYKYARKIAGIINDNNCLMAFNIKQLDAYEEKYGLKIENKEDKCLPVISAYIAPTDNEISERALKRQSDFVISACARFEFPHKGFLIGLIRLLPQIVEIIPNVSLQIIGYGDSQAIETAIAALTPDLQNKIKLIGQTSPEELNEIYKNSCLVVGLAGAASRGASCGVPTLITRHNCYNCETYGWYHETNGRTLSDEPGKDILPYIKNISEMTTEAYCALTKNEIETYKGTIETRNSDAETFYRFPKTKLEVIVRKSTILRGHIFTIIAKIPRLWARIFRR
ncbi:MAG: glycosyltransferase family 4 protein [Clostridia bacterium]|nr:glycosyltransferase family 4 protein [Clostridia bacterium]